MSLAQVGSQIYTPFVLRLYDWFVLSLSNTFAWRCPTRKYLLPFFEAHVGNKHLDVGVGTGFYFANSARRPLESLTLLDLNENSLIKAASRVSDIRPSCLAHDITKPLPWPKTHVFDSISMFYLLHCLPGTMPEKAPAISHVKSHLSKTGKLYGATILGANVKHNSFGQKLMEIYNQLGIFSNNTDSIDELKLVLESQFQHVTIQQCGMVALFVASDSQLPDA